MIQVERSFFGLEIDWNYLYEQGEYTVFQSLSYNKIAFDYIHKKDIELYLLIYKDQNDKVLAIFPTYLHSGILRFINDRNTDFCDVLIDENAKEHEVFSELIEFINGDSHIKSIILDNIRPESVLLSFFKVYSRTSLTYCINEYSFLNCRPLDNVYDNFSNLTNDKKKKLKKIILNKENCDFRIYKGEFGDSFPKKQLQDIFDIMVSKGIRSASTFDEQFWRFVESCYSNNIIEIGILKRDGRPLSAGMVFYNSNVSVRWVILYTEPKYNLWNNTHYIIDKCSNISSMYEINFGRGGYDYKINNFKPELSLLYRLSFSKTTFGRINQSLIAFFFFLKPTIKLLLRK